MAKKGSQLTVRTATEIQGGEFVILGYAGRSYQMTLNELKKFIGIIEAGGGSVDLTQVSTDILPLADASKDIGSLEKRWKKVYSTALTVKAQSVDEEEVNIHDGGIEGKIGQDIQWSIDGSGKANFYELTINGADVATMQYVNDEILKILGGSNGGTTTQLGIPRFYTIIDMTSEPTWNTSDDLVRVSIADYRIVYDESSSRFGYAGPWDGTIPSINLIFYPNFDIPEYGISTQVYAFSQFMDKVFRCEENDKYYRWNDDGTDIEFSTDNSDLQSQIDVLAQKIAQLEQEIEDLKANGGGNVPTTGVVDLGGADVSSDATAIDLGGASVTGINTVDLGGA